MKIVIQIFGFLCFILFSGLQTSCSRFDEESQLDKVAAKEEVLVGDFEIIFYPQNKFVDNERLLLSQILDLGLPVVLNFWAGLCPPCRREMPDFQSTYDFFNREVVFLGIDLGPFTGLGSVEQGVELLKKLNITYPAGTTEDSTVLPRFQVFGMPTTFFLAPDGKLVRKWTGELSEDELIEFTSELLSSF